MFNLINIDARAGSGIPNIYRIWRKQGWREPTIAGSFESERISLVLPLEKSADKKSLIETADKRKSAKTKGRVKKSSPI